MKTSNHPPVSLSELLSAYRRDISPSLSSSNHDNHFIIRGTSYDGAALGRAVTLRDLLLNHRKIIDGSVNVESHKNVVARSRAIHDHVLLINSESAASSQTSSMIHQQDVTHPPTPQSSSSTAAPTGPIEKCPDTFGEFVLHLSPESSVTSSQHLEVDANDKVSVELDIVEDEKQQQQRRDVAVANEIPPVPQQLLNQQTLLPVTFISDSCTTNVVPVVVSQISIRDSINNDHNSIEFDEDNIPVYVKRPFTLDDCDALESLHEVSPEAIVSGNSSACIVSSGIPQLKNNKKRKREITSRYRTGRLFHVLKTSLLMLHSSSNNIPKSCANNRLKSRIPIIGDTLSIVNGCYPPISTDEECRTLILRFDRQLHADHFGSDASVPIEAGGFTAAQIRNSFQPPKISTRSSSVCSDDIDWISQISIPMSVLIGFEYGVDSHEDTISTLFAVVFTESAMKLKDWSIDAIIARITNHSKLENRLCWNIMG